jgi:glucose-1-phosphatase
MKIRNIIFDLGGVLLNIDFNKTAAAFTALGIKNFDDYFTQFHADPLFKRLELGGMPDNNFFDELRSTASITADNNSIIVAWNSMLLDFPEERIERLKKLKTDYRLFLFSNTNAIHHEAFHQAFRNRFGFNMDELFEKVYYSHVIRHRKPDPASFLYVINDSKLDPAETAFIDDTMPNVEAARKVGLLGIHVPPGKSLLDVLDENL